MEYTIIKREKGKKSVVGKGSLPRMNERLMELRGSQGKETYELVRIEEDEEEKVQEKVRCCAHACRKKSVAKGVCADHAGEDTRLCLGLGCEKWIIKKSRHHCFCESCNNRNAGIGGKIEHAARFG